MIKTGYGFGGWYKEAVCANEWNFTIDTVTRNITLYAKWDTNYHTVNFNANGGNPAPDSQNIAHGGKVVMLPAMTKTGYTFDSWYKEESCINQWNFATDTIVGDTTLYAKWLENFTVTFEANGGTPQPELQIVADGGKVVEPSAISKTDFSFDGWYKEAAYTNLWDFNNDKVSGNITLYAKWGPPVIVAGTSLAAKLAWLNTNARSGGAYLLEVTDFYEDLVPQTLFYNGKSNITVQLNGIGSARAVILSGSGSLFSIRSGVTLVLDNNLTLSGTNNYNTAPLVSVDIGGKLIMNQGSKISGNSSGGVYISDSGTFTMNDGEISGNDGGVYISGSGTFTMNSGVISGNYSSGGVYVSDSGTFTMIGGEISGNDGGVYVGSGTFTMIGGKISGNHTSTSSHSAGYGTDGKYYNNYYSYGGGVYVDSGTFTMSGGEISGNYVSSYAYFGDSHFYSYGGGVYVDSGTFTMNGGEISGNYASASASASLTNANRNKHPYSYGGGVYVDSGTFTMNGGEISANYASSSSSSSSSAYPSSPRSYGGGVYVDNGTFTMSGGKISDNYASSSFSINYDYSRDTESYGGGVCMGSGTFTMNDGVISGNSALYGGGVYMGSGTFPMNGGEISGNSASSFGGGVLVGDAIFAKTGGIITGYSSDAVNGNVVKDSSGVVKNDLGHAIYAGYSDYLKRKETTAGQTDNLTYIRRVYPPIWDGAWDN
jgi:uncharacterized repeat protein (TIGR02543 family)